MNISNTSPCCGCAFGEKSTGGVFCLLIGEVVPVGYPRCKRIENLLNGMLTYQEYHPQESDRKEDIEE